MTPKDATPLGDEMAHSMPEPQFPQPKPGEGSDEPVRGQPSAGKTESDPDMGHRPTLPEHPEPMAADIEDEEADPVIDSGPGISDALTSLKKQKG